MFNEQQKALSEQLKEGVRKLYELLSNNEEGVQSIINTFISETPKLFLEIDVLIDKNAWRQTAAIVHKIKSRYSYIGLHEIYNELDVAEAKLLKGTIDNDTLLCLEKVKQVNPQIIADLKTMLLEKQALILRDKNFAGKTILVAEDDPVNAMVFELFVKETGASALVAINGNEALQMAMDKKPDLIFMDVHMPFLSGLDVIKKLRSAGCTCPIVSLSASIRLNEKQNSLDAGANDFLVKPANRSSIRNLIIKYLK
ncbi:MAG: response regulator [Cytophagia bacterium]|nr:response regulator [Cytophagia bacterium]NBW34673.1 response regulator [Cytophagia bacterium]